MSSFAIHLFRPQCNFLIMLSTLKFLWLGWLHMSVQKSRFTDHSTVCSSCLSWLSGVAVAYQRCRASDRGSVPGLASGRSRPTTVPCKGSTTGGIGAPPGVMKLWVAWEVLPWLMKFRELYSGGFHPKLVTPPYHGFLNVNTPPNSQNSKRH